jgi:hypothetical protein
LREKAAGAHQPEWAETVAIQALAFIAEEPERLGRFLAITGLGPDSLRQAARQPDFLASVLDHIMGDESLLVAFAAGAEIKPMDVGKARRQFSRSAGEHEGS